MQNQGFQTKTASKHIPVVLGTINDEICSGSPKTELKKMKPKTATLSQIHLVSKNQILRALHILT